jgi:hypothetical protein
MVGRTSLVETGAQIQGGAPQSFIRSLTYATN